MTRTQNPAFLIKLFMSFMFATKAEMGYDDMIERHDNRRYTYQIPDPKGSRFFRTIDTILEDRSSNITGRMTRIYLVEEVTSSALEATPVMPRRTCVLKDMWLDESAAMEREIQDNIFKDIESFFALLSLPVRVSLIFMYFSLFISHFSLLYLCRYLICLLCLIIF